MTAARDASPVHQVVPPSVPSIAAHVRTPSSVLVEDIDDRAFIEHLAFLFLSHDRADRAVALFVLLAHDAAADDPIHGALALAQLRAGKPKAAFTTLSARPFPIQVRAPYQLLRAQILGALGRHDEAARAMRAFAAALAADPLHAAVAARAAADV